MYCVRYLYELQTTKRDKLNLIGRKSSTQKPQKKKTPSIKIY